MSITPSLSLSPITDRPAQAAILGGGISGRAAARLLEKLGCSWEILDEARDASLGPNGNRHQFVVVSPGFRPDHLWLQSARREGLPVLPELELASLHWRGKILAVTGTNGKSSLTRLLASALREAGMTAFEAGNIGTAFSEVVLNPHTEETWAVVEVSSFQAEMLTVFRPSVVAWTNFFADHLDRHVTLEGYFRAKAQLVATLPARSPVFCGLSVEEAARVFLPNSPYRWVLPATGPVPAFLEGTPFRRRPQMENFLVADSLWGYLGFPREALIRAAQNFAMLPHRLALVAEIAGVNYWNDSKATNFHAAEEALCGFARPVHWIGGGSDKGVDPLPFFHRVSNRILRAYVIGETASCLAEAAREAGVSVEECGSLQVAVERAASAARPGEEVLLSPGYASFDQFRNYAERGEQFVQLIQNLRPVSILS